MDRNGQIGTSSEQDSDATRATEADDDWWLFTLGQNLARAFNDLERLGSRTPSRRHTYLAETLVDTYARYMHDAIRDLRRTLPHVGVSDDTPAVGLTSTFSAESEDE